MVGTKRMTFAVVLALAWAIPLAQAADDAENFPKQASGSERAALAKLDEEIDGAVVYARKGRIRKVVIGDWREQDLGEGEFARWSPDGERVAVYHKGKVHVMDADGRNRRKLVDDADKADGCPIEFHTDNRRIVFWRKREGFHAVDVETGKTEKLDLPGRYSGSAGFAADGKRMAVRWGKDLYAVDVPAGKHRKFARGCSPGVSPDGKWLMNNNGGHRTMTLREWDGKRRRKIDVRTMSGDKAWDNHHWSNHADYIAAQGEKGGGYAHVVRISTNRCTRVCWEKHVQYPDLWVKPEK
jgi:Tol biopolymer transport system component